MKEITTIKDPNVVSEIKYWLKELRSLENTLVKKAVYDYNKEFNMLVFGLVFETIDNKEKIMWILSDEEGNNGGRFEINDVVKKLKTEEN